VLAIVLTSHRNSGGIYDEEDFDDDEEDFD